MITPHDYRVMRDLAVNKVDELLSALEAIRDEAENCHEPSVLTHATSKNITPGNIIWFVTDDELQTYWVIVEDSLVDGFFTADDGGLYSLDGAYIEVMQQ